VSASVDGTLLSGSEGNRLSLPLPLPPLSSGHEKNKEQTTEARLLPLFSKGFVPVAGAEGTSHPGWASAVRNLGKDHKESTEMSGTARSTES